MADIETAAPTTDFDAIPLEDLRESLATGQAPTAAAVAPALEPVPADPAAVPEPVATPAGEPEQPAEPEVPVETPKEVEEVPVETDALKRVQDFKFTENADAATLATEEAAYLELVELSEPVQQMLDRRNAQIAELATAQPAAEPDALQVEHNSAFDALVRERETEDGEWVPNTAPLRELLATRYPQETDQLIRDMLTAPSQKYPGHTVFLEITRDMGGFGDSQMDFLTNYIQNGGKIPVPSFTPPGIDAKVSEAYWNNPERDAITERVQRAQFTIDSIRATEEEIMEAKADLVKVNQTLAFIQKGIDADAEKRQLAQQGQTSAVNEIRQAGAVAYEKTTIGLMEQGQAELAKTLTMFDEPAAKVTAAGFSMLINAALSDANGYAKNAQAQLAAQGIKVNWTEASGALTRLYRQEQEIIHLEKRGANPRAVGLAKGDKNKIILEIKGFEKNITGQIVKTLTQGAGKALKTTLENAPKVPAVRPRVNGDGSPIGTKPNFDDMPLDKLREVTFGRAPIESLAQ